ncbi:MAG: hypothetical protein AAGD38_24750 [Acidobacteriota bacterium]
MTKRLHLALVILTLLLATTASADSRRAGLVEFEAIPGSLDDALLTVLNPHLDRTIGVEVALSSSTEPAERTYRLELEAGGHTILVIDGSVIFDRLSATSTDHFDVELLRADGRRLERSGPRVATRSSSITCSGQWTLTCINCTGGPYTHTGWVESGDQVYWNLNTPTGSWTTIGDQGITATWYPGPSGCPVMVTNSVGYTYSISSEKLRITTA